MFKFKVRSGNNEYYTIHITKKNLINEVGYFSLEEINELNYILSNQLGFNFKNFNVNDKIYIESLEWERCNYNLVITSINHNTNEIYVDTVSF